MKNSCSILILCFTITLTYALPIQTESRTSDFYQCTCGYRVEYIDSWPGHLKGRVTIPLASPVTQGWTLDMQFSDPVTGLRFINGEVRGTQDGFTYEIQNQQHNGNLQTQLSEEFIVSFDAGRQPTVYPRFRNQPECECIPVTTSAPATDGWVPGCLVSSCTCGSSTRKTDNWQDNIKGEFRIPVTTATTSWNLALHFSVPVDLQIWRAIPMYSSSDRKTHYLRNPDYHGNLSPGDVLEMEFIATYSTQNEPIWDAQLSDQDVCSVQPENLATEAEEPQCTCGYCVDYIDTWPGHLKARVTIPLVNPVTQGWTLFLQFTDPVTGLQFFNGIDRGTRDNGYTYKVKNRNHNAQLQNQLREEFIVTFNGPQPAVYPRLKNQPKCNCTEEVTTQTPTTKENVQTTLTTNAPLTTDGGWVPGCQVSSCTCGSSIRKTQEWRDNIKGEFRIPVTTATTSWNLILRFSVPVDLQIWRAIPLYSSSDRKTHYLRNPDYNGNLIPGDVLEMEFIATYTSPVQPIWDAELSDQDVCGDPPATTTQASTTTVRPSTKEATSPATTKRPLTERSTSAATTVKQTTKESTYAATAQKTITTEATSTATTQKLSTEEPTSATTQRPSTELSTEGPTTATTQKQSTEEPTSAATTQKPSTESATTQVPSTQEFVTTQSTQEPGLQLPYSYAEVLNKSIQFYEAQRSGRLPLTQRVKWRNNSTQNDGNDVGHDLEGGWFDAGDYVKFGLPMAQTATTLAWGAIEFKDAYTAAGQMDWMRDCLKWATDYFLKCHTGPTEFYAQVGHGQTDHGYWGRPEDFIGYRPSYKVDASNPGSDVVGETAAALAAASIVFRDTNTTYANLLLQSATDLYAFANMHRGIYQHAIPDAGQYYPSSGYGDELAWAAAWLHVATGDPTYLSEAEQHYQTFNLNGPAWAFSWDDKKAGVQLLLHNITQDTQYASSIDNTLAYWLPGGGIDYTPKGLAYRDIWGVNRYAANMAFLSLVRAKHMTPDLTRANLGSSKADEYRAFGASQINYMLGDGGQSYVIGFGSNSPTHPHHRSSSCPKTGPCDWNNYNAPGPNPQELTGALVGGPDRNDNFQNDRSDYIYNEVTTDYNAGFQSAVAGVYDLYLSGLAPVDQPDLGFLGLHPDLTV